MMSYPLRLLVLFLVGVSLWLLLACWLPGGSERFYVIFPILFVAHECFVVRQPRTGWQRRVLGLVVAAGILMVVAAIYGWSLSRALSATSSFRLTSGFLFEVTAAALFLGTVTLVLLISRGSLRRLILGIEHRVFVGSESESRSRRARLALCDLAVLFVLLAFGVPYFLGAAYVHRFKVANDTAPVRLDGRVVEEVEFSTTDGLTLRGWFVAASKPSHHTLIICHGLGANRSNFLPYLRVGQAIDAHVLLFDFRGHGESDGHTVSMGRHERLDVLAALHYLRTERPAQARQVVGLGISMGASALTLAAAEAEPPFDALILDSGFAAATDLTDSVLQVFPAPVRTWLIIPGIPLASLHAGCWLDEVRPVDCVHRVRAPILFIHAGDDRLIPPEHSRRLYHAAIEPKEIWIAPRGGHGSALFLAESDYLAAASKLASCLPGSP